MSINGYFVITYIQLLPHSILVYTLVSVFLLIYLSLLAYLGYMAIVYNTQQPEQPYMVRFNHFIKKLDLFKTSFCFWYAMAQKFI